MQASCRGQPDRAKQGLGKEASSWHLPDRQQTPLEWAEEQQTAGLSCLPATLTSCCCPWHSSGPRRCGSEALAICLFILTASPRRSALGSPVYQ